MNYWTGTDDFEARNGGPPSCPYCGNKMAAADDHGRYTCFDCDFGTYDVFLGVRLPRRRVPQVTDSMPEGTDLPDDVKKDIPPINRLRLPPTAEEQAVLDRLDEMLRSHPNYPKD